jgi:hypothetical protein
MIPLLLSLMLDGNRHKPSGFHKSKPGENVRYLVDDVGTEAGPSRSDDLIVEAGAVRARET